MFDKLKPEEKQRILEEKYGIEPDDGMGKGMETMCNLSEGIWERGMPCGMQRGMERGRMEGEKKLRKVVLNMVRNGVSDEDICMMVECDMAYLAEIKKNFVY